MASGTEENLEGVWGSSSSNVFAVGEGGTILHYGGIATPTLVSPACRAVICDRTPYLDWSKVTGCSTIHYRLQVDNNADFSSPVVSKTWVSYSYYTVTTSLSHGTYHWRVRSVDASGRISPWTADWTFTVA